MPTSRGRGRCACVSKIEGEAEGEEVVSMAIVVYGEGRTGEVDEARPFIK
jgi:hypothetical protein